MSEPINRDAMHLAIRLYAAKAAGDYAYGFAPSDAAFDVSRTAAVEDARELILASRKLQRTSSLDESQQIFDRLTVIMQGYGIEVQFRRGTDALTIMLNHDHFSGGKIPVPQ